MYSREELEKLNNYIWDVRYNYDNFGINSAVAIGRVSGLDSGRIFDEDNGILYGYERELENVNLYCPEHKENMYNKIISLVPENIKRLMEGIIIDLSNIQGMPSFSDDNEVIGNYIIDIPLNIQTKYNEIARLVYKLFLELSESYPNIVVLNINELHRSFMFGVLNIFSRKIDRRIKKSFDVYRQRNNTVDSVGDTRAEVIDTIKRNRAQEEFQQLFCGKTVTENDVFLQNDLSEIIIEKINQFMLKRLDQDLYLEDVKEILIDLKNNLSQVIAVGFLAEKSEPPKNIVKICNIINDSLNNDMVIGVYNIGIILREIKFVSENVGNNDGRLPSTQRIYNRLADIKEQEIVMLLETLGRNESDRDKISDDENESLNSTFRTTKYRTENTRSSTDSSTRTITSRKSNISYGSIS